MSKVSLTPAKVALAATAAPMPALADDVAPPQLQPIGQVQPANQMQVTGRVTYSRFLELWHARATKPQGSVRACVNMKSYTYLNLHKCLEVFTVIFDILVRSIFHFAFLLWVSSLVHPGIHQRWLCEAC